MLQRQTYRMRGAELGSCKGSPEFRWEETQETGGSGATWELWGDEGQSGGERKAEEACGCGGGVSRARRGAGSWLPGDLDRSWGSSESQFPKHSSAYSPGKGQGGAELNKWLVTLWGDKGTDRHPQIGREGQAGQRQGGPASGEVTDITHSRMRMGRP